MQVPGDGWSQRKQFFALADGQRLAYIDSIAETNGRDDRPVLVLLHGYTDTSRSFSLLAPMLGAYRLVIPDLPGHGSSDAGEVISVSSIADEIAGLLASIMAGPMIVAGHSMGSMVATMLAARPELDVAALVLISGARRPRFAADAGITRAIRALKDPVDIDGPYLDAWHDCALPVAADFLALVRGEAASVKAAVWHALLDDFASIDLADPASRYRGRVLSLGGELDPLFSAADRAELAAAFSSCTSHNLHAHGHNPHWESPALATRLIDQFIREVGRGIA